jgi:ATP-binding cassette subfamily B protein
VGGSATEDRRERKCKEVVQGAAKGFTALLIKTQRGTLHMKKLKRTLGNLLFLLEPWWKHGRLLLLGKLALPLLLAPALAYIDVRTLQAIIDSFVAGNSLRATLITAAVFEGSWLALNIIRWVFLLGYERWKLQEVRNKITRSVYAQVALTDYKYFDNPEFYNDFTFAAGEFTARSAAAVDFICGLTASVTVGVTMVAYLAGQGVLIILITALCSAACICTQSKISKCGVDRAAESVPSERKMAYVFRLIYQKNFAADARSTGIFRSVTELFDKGSDGQVRTYKKYAKPFVTWNLLNFIPHTLMELAVLAYLIVRAYAANNTIGALTGMFAAAKRLYGQLDQFVTHSGTAVELNLYAEKVRNFFELKSEIEPSSGGCAAPEGALSLELHGVSFAYPNSDFALRNVNISIAAGEKIAIVGENGAGKTTLSKLLLRLYDIDGGEILYNGTAVADYDVHALRRKIGVAFQTPQLYALTVRDNMQVYQSASDETLRSVLNAVGLDLELDHEVTREFNENGIMLSGGQTQKLGLSRLLVGEFGLLLLDEPSSALDPIAEYEMTKLMFDLSRTTTIMVAHRLSTIRYADRIYLISSGEVAEQGTHDELIALGGKYAEMFAKQAENYVG